MSTFLTSEICAPSGSSIRSMEVTLSDEPMTAKE